MKPRSARQRRAARATAYYRLAAKETRAGNYKQAEWYRKTADRIMEQSKRETEREQIRKQQRGQ